MNIVDFEPAHAEAFRTLNEAWIEKLFVLEAKDRAVLSDPQGEIIDRGGQVFMAIHDGAPVGCAALMRMADGGYEVAKMTVSEQLRGSGLGRRLMQRCIDAGAEAGATRLYLETSSRLAPAIALYRAMGFRDLAPADTPYVRADVFMERLYEAPALQTGLHLVEAGIDATGGDQVVVTALLDDPQLGQHQDAVGVAHGRQAVGNDQGCPGLREV